MVMGLVCFRISDGSVLFQSLPWPVDSHVWLLDHARWANRQVQNAGFVWMPYEVLPEASS